jgi:hypothetical protein
MRLAHARQQHDVLGALDEAQAGELADLLAVDRGLNVEVVLIQALEPGQPGQLEAALDAALVPPARLGLQGVGEEPLVVEIALGDSSGFESLNMVRTAASQWPLSAKAINPCIASCVTSP